MLIGYARVSSKAQSLSLQEDRLKEHGCDKIFSDFGVSGAKAEREGLDKALSWLREGDSLIVSKLDRLARSLKHLLQIIDIIREKKAHLISLSEGINTDTATGNLIFNIFGVIAEFERSLIAERIEAGKEKARQNGVKFGRKHKLSKEQLELMIDLKKQGKSPKQIYSILGISKATYYNYLNEILKT